MARFTPCFSAQKACEYRPKRTLSAAIRNLFGHLFVPFSPRKGIIFLPFRAEYVPFRALPASVLYGSGVKGTTVPIEAESETAFFDWSGWQLNPICFLYIKWANLVIKKAGFLAGWLNQCYYSLQSLKAGRSQARSKNLK